MFVDETTLEVTAGRGGDGVTAFHREKYRPRGGPDGGDGGHGGDVVLAADPSVATLVEYHFHPHQRARKGTHGQGNNRKGSDGADRLLPVPVGTMVRDEDGRLLADLATPGARFVAARGGRGGRGNASLSAGRRVAHFHERGEPGQQRRLRLELRLLADVGLVGFPNAGKSSIVARSSVLVHVLDLVPIEQGRDPERDLAALEAELEAYDPDLATRPALVAGNKVDLPEGRARLPEAEAAAARRELPFFAISAATGEGMPALLYAIADAVAGARAAEGAEQPAERPEDAAAVAEPEAPIEVVREEGGWRVLGDRPARWVAMADLDNAEAVEYLQRRLRRAGVDDLLAEAGAEPGDEVMVGDAAFEYEPDALADPPGRRGPGRR